MSATPSTKAPHAIRTTGSSGEGAASSSSSSHTSAGSTLAARGHNKRPTNTKQPTGNRHTTAAEQRARRRRQAVTHRPGQIRHQPEGAQHSEDEQRERERVGAMGAEMAARGFAPTRESTVASLATDRRGGAGRRAGARRVLRRGRRVAVCGIPAR